MLEIDEYLKQIYKNDTLPNVSELAHKELILYFPDLDLTVNNKKIVGESFKLEESLCSEEDLTFGACESAQINITVADISQDLKGQLMVVTQKLNETYTMPLGTYRVDSAKKQADMRFKDIIAYDNMTMFDVDVSDWYNGLTFPILLKDFRLSLCAYIGTTCVDQTLPNDSMVIEKTITPTMLSGRDVLKKIAEINGCFGHITRDNKLKFIGLSAIGLYPSETLYPAEDLFPSENSEYVGMAGYKNSVFEEYTVQSITSLQIREQEGDIGVTVGSGDNCYIIQDNFLTFGKSADQLTTTANNVLPMIKNKTYRPHTTNIVGLPYLEVGDAISIVTNTDVIETFVLKRTLTGIQALNDEISASGNEKREATTSISQKIEQLNSKQMKLKADVDGLEMTLTGDGGVMSQISATAEQISAEVTRATQAEGQLSGAIEIVAGQVQLKASSSEVSSMISVAIDNITISSNQINLNGFVSANNSFFIDENGTLYLNSGYINNLNGGGGSINVNSALIFPSSRYLVIDGKYPALEGHTHNTYGSITAELSSSSLGYSDLIRFSNTSGTSQAATAAYVQSYASPKSDERIKKNIKPIEDITNKYMKLNPIEYDWKLSDGHDYGFGAHEISNVLPHITRINTVISKEEQELCPDGLWEIKYNALHALHTKMIQKHELEIKALIRRIDKLERKRGIKQWRKHIAELIGRINRPHRQH